MILKKVILVEFIFLELGRLRKGKDSDFSHYQFVLLDEEDERSFDEVLEKVDEAKEEIKGDMKSLSQKVDQLGEALKMELEEIRSMIKN